MFFLLKLIIKTTLQPYNNDYDLLKWLIQKTYFFITSQLVNYPAVCCFIYPIIFIIVIQDDYTTSLTGNPLLKSEKITRVGTVVILDNPKYTHSQ